MKPWLIPINDFCHDLFTGLWFGSFVTILVLRNKVGDRVLLSELNHLFTVLSFTSLIAIMLSDIFRFFYYRDWEGRDMAGIRKRLLKIKQALLGGTSLVILWAI